MANWQRGTHWVYILMGLSWLVSLILILDCLAVLRGWPLSFLPSDAYFEVKNALFDIFGARQWLPVLLFLVFSFFWISSVWALFIGRPNRRLRIVWQIIVVMVVIAYSGGLAVFLLHDVINESLYSKLIFLVFLLVPLSLMSGIGIGLTIIEGVDKATQDANYGLMRAAEILRDIEIRQRRDAIELTHVKKALESCQGLVRTLDQNFAIQDGGFWYTIKAMHRYPRLYARLADTTLLLHEALADAQKGLRENIVDEFRAIEEAIPGKKARTALINSLPQLRSDWIATLDSRTALAVEAGDPSDNRIERD